MRHVTDGEIHVFLDGALDLLPEDRGEEVRAHIASCSVCRERLQDEETLRSRAEMIMGDPALDEVPLPTFEELRERAEAPGPVGVTAGEDQDSQVRYRGPLRGLPLAWAATIVLAVGVGWMGGEVMRTGPNGALMEGAGRLDLQEGPARDSAAAGSSQVREREFSPARVVVPPASPEAGEVGNTQGSPGSEDTREQMSLASAPVVPDSPQALVSTAVDTQSDLAESTVAASRRAVASPEVQPAMEFTNKTMGREEEVAPEGFGLIPDSLENSLVVPGLKVVSVEWEERAQGEKVLNIRQLLSQGDTLELRYLGMLLGADSEPREEGEGLLDVPSGGWAYANVLEATLPPGWNQVVMEWGRGLLVARAPIPEANIKALLKTLH